MRLGSKPCSTALLTVLLHTAGCGGDVDPPGQPSEDFAPTPPAPTSPVLGPEACRDAGYLCTGLAERDEPRILRWSDTTRELRIRVPSPPMEARSLSRQFQDAAALGILAWQDKPFAIRIDRTGRDRDSDIVVRWVDALGGTELGRAETQWSRGTDGTMAMEVRDFVLVLRDPFDPAGLLDPDAVRLAAAHEMGHALGLPHSDSERDVMYPMNTATTLSPRDYRTMAALYSTENGALLGPGG
jgi:predicted Zn-dependent protease